MELEIKLFLAGLELFFLRGVSILIFSAIVSLVICTIYRFFYCIYKLKENSEYGYESWFISDLFFKLNGFEHPVMGSENAIYYPDIDLSEETQSY